jgi:preprotein translocase subunit SecE
LSRLPFRFLRSSSEFCKKMANLFRFFQEVRTEADKVTWPNRRETMITTVLVILLAVLTSLFFLVVDEVVHFLIWLIFNPGDAWQHVQRFFGR